MLTTLSKFKIMLGKKKNYAGSLTKVIKVGRLWDHLLLWAHQNYNCLQSMCWWERLESSLKLYISFTTKDVKKEPQWERWSRDI